MRRAKSLGRRSVSPRRFARSAGVSIRTVREWLKRGWLRHRRLGLGRGFIAIPTSELGRLRALRGANGKWGSRA